MNLVSSLLAVTSISEETFQEVPTQIQSSDIIGIGGIIATIIVGIVTSYITWKLTMKSIKQLKLSYNVEIYPILSNSITNNPNFILDDLKVQYNGKVLQNPCLLTIQIENTGNEAIIDPPIKIKNEDNIEIIPGYFQDIPHGYNELWCFNKDTNYSCSLALKHINPKQIVKARFFLENIPQNKIQVECPMPNLQIQEVSYSSLGKAPNKLTEFYNSNLILIALTMLLFVSIPQWSVYIYDFIRITGVRMQAESVVVFIMSMLLMSVILNNYGVIFIDKYIKSHTKQAVLIKTILLIISILLLSLIIFDLFITDMILQTITAAIVVVLLAFFIHFSFITQKINSK